MANAFRQTLTEATPNSRGAPALLATDRNVSDSEVLTVDRATCDVTLKAAFGSITFPWWPARK